jgi:hypothetical protein
MSGWTKVRTGGEEAHGAAAYYQREPRTLPGTRQSSLVNEEPARALVRKRLSMPQQQRRNSRDLRDTPSTEA